MTAEEERNLGTARRWTLLSTMTPSVSATKCSQMIPKCISPAVATGIWDEKPAAPLCAPF